MQNGVQKAERRFAFIGRLWYDRQEIKRRLIESPVKEDDFEVYA